MRRLSRAWPGTVKGIVPHHRRPISAAALSLVSRTTIDPAAATTSDSKSNVTILLADDVGWSEVGVHGEAGRLIYDCRPVPFIGGGISY